MRPLLPAFRPLVVAPGLVALTLLTGSAPRVPAPRPAPAAAPASGAMFGAPWMSVELPANPLDPTTKGAFLVVHTYYHREAVPVTLEGRAERLDGAQTSFPMKVQLTFERTSRPGVYAVRRTWQAEGRWLLSVTMSKMDRGPTLLVGVANGEVRTVRVPSEERGGWTLPRPATDADYSAVRQAIGG
jgi:hypothetical protein